MTAVGIQNTVVIAFIRGINRTVINGVRHVEKKFENTLTKLYKPSVPIIICGDFNINFLDQTSRAIELALLLQSFSLESIIKFPTRITPDSQSLIDNSFLHKKNFSITSLPCYQWLVRS